MCNVTADGHHVFGIVRHDDTGRIERPFAYPSQHFHSNRPDLIVGDGPSKSHHVVLWRRDGDGYSPPRIVCEHKSSRKTQYAHVHPRISPDGSHIVFTSDRTGHCQVYTVAMPDFGSLREAPAR